MAARVCVHICMHVCKDLRSTSGAVKELTEPGAPYLTDKAQGPSHLSFASINTETINVHQLAWLLMWVLRIELKVLLFTWLLL